MYLIPRDSTTSRVADVRVALAASNPLWYILVLPIIKSPYNGLSELKITSANIMYIEELGYYILFVHTHRKQKLTLLHIILFTDQKFHQEIFPHSSEYLQGLLQTDCHNFVKERSINLANTLKSEDKFPYETDL